VISFTQFPHVNVGDRICAREDGLIHVIDYATHRHFDVVCEDIYDNMQLSYEFDRAEEYEIELRDITIHYRKVDDAEPTTCIRCLLGELLKRPADQRDVFSDVDE
jgi:hypothetical protein